MKKSYVGSIGNGGTQNVTAPNAKSPAKTGKVVRGGDLRSGKKKA